MAFSNKNSHVKVNKVDIYRHNLLKYSKVIYMSKLINFMILWRLKYQSFIYHIKQKDYYNWLNIIYNNIKVKSKT